MVIQEAMLLPILMLFALMACSNSCPDLCECDENDGRSKSNSTRTTRDITCRGHVPALWELPTDARKLTISDTDEYQVIHFFDQLEFNDTTMNFEEVTGEPNSYDIYNVTRTLLNLVELTVTNCSLDNINSSWIQFERFRHLNFSSNNFVELNNIGFIRAINMSQLRTLDLSWNLMKELGTDGFRTLSGLVKLCMRRNNIMTVHKNAFRGLDLLERLDLADNKLTNLPDSALLHLYSLQKLDLSGNQLQVLGAKWFENLDKLRELDVSRNGIARAASGTLQPLPGLSVLRLSENPLKDQDVSLLLGTGRRLETVDASHTGLARVPAALTRSVRTLRLAGNKLTSVHGGDLDSYPLLRTLDISENRLLDIEDDALGRLEVLEELTLGGNDLVKVPGSLPSSLTILDLRRNRITLLRSNDMQGLNKLRILRLNNNNISEIEEGGLGQLTMLTELDISDNPIKSLPANTLSGPSNLATLRMSGLTCLEWEQPERGDMTFPVPTPERLLLLDISRSPILAAQFLADDAALSACKSLLELDLSNTNITTLRSDLTYLMPQLRNLGLNGNDWNCTQDIYWLGDWLRKHEKLEYARCVEPEEFYEIHLYDLPPPPPPLPLTSFFTNYISTVSRTTVFDKDKTSSMYISEYSTTEIDNDKEPTTTEIVSQIYEAPTSFKNVTESLPTAKNLGYLDFLGEKTEIIQTGDSTSTMNTLSRGEISENQTRYLDGGHQKLVSTEAIGKISKKLESHVQYEGKKRKVLRKKSETKVRNGATQFVQDISSKLVLKTTDRPESIERMPQQQGVRKMIESDTIPDITKENLVLADGPDSKTTAEKLNGRSIDLGARISEPLVAGAHPGMLILVGVALVAAAAFSVVLSKRATTRRHRDRYHRHENIEVHTLTPITELW